MTWSLLVLVIRNSIALKRSPMYRLSLLTCLACCSMACSAWGQVQRSTTQPQGIRRAVPACWAMLHARVIPDSSRVIEDATVVIRDGRIQAFGSVLDIPADARRIDLKGRSVYPGLIDAYTEQGVTTSGIDSGFPYWNEQIRPQLRIAGQFKPDQKQNETFRGQGITARLVAPEGGILKGTGAVVLTSDIPPAHAVIRADVTQHARLTINRGRDDYPNSPMGAVALARQACYDADWYRQAWQAVEGDPALPAPEINDALQALEETLDARTPLVVETSNELFVLRADRFAREFGLNLIVKGSGNEYRRLDAIQQTGRPIIVPVNFPKPPNVGTFESALDVNLETLMHWDHAPENPARLEAAGIRFAFCSQGLKDRSKFLTQVRKAVRRGLSPEAALDALTSVPAELFGVGQQVGRIRAGLLANLVITDGNLFEKETKVVETWIAGERFEHEPEPVRNVAGAWRIESANNALPGTDATLVLKEEKGKVTGTIRSGDEEPIELMHVVLNGARLSGTIDGNQLDRPGIVRGTVVIDQDSQRGIGHVAWPDGSRESLIIRRTAEAIGDDSESENEAEDDAEEEEEEEEVTAGPASFPVSYPLGAFGYTQLPEQPSIVVFRNATVWTCGPKGTLKQASVLVQEGRIVAVGRRIDVPEGALVVDAEGMHLTPGIIDCHSHMATDGGVNESGQAITAEVRIGDFVDCDDIDIYRQLAGGVTAANILHGSANPIGGQNQVIKLRWGATGDEMKMQEAPAGIKFALGENVKQSNWGDDHTTRYPQTRMGVEQIFIDEFRAAREYATERERWQTDRTGLPPRRDLELDAIVEILNKQRWVHCHSYRQDEILALIRVLDHFGIQIGTFQHILEGYKIADAMARHGAMGSAFSDWWAYKFEVYDAIPFAGALMHNASVVVSFNSDNQELARHLNHEAAKAVKYGGVSPTEALKFVTLNPARQLRIDASVGSIEPGKHADLVLWSQAPLSTMSRCEQTWIDGRKYFDRSDDLALRQRDEQIRASLIQKVLDSDEQMQKLGESDEDPANLWPRVDLFCHGHGHEHLHQ